jgi:hypothetical protein
LSKEGTLREDGISILLKLERKIRSRVGSGKTWKSVQPKTIFLLFCSQLGENIEKPYIKTCRFPTELNVKAENPS